MDTQTVLDETEKALDVIEDKLDAIEEIGDVAAKHKATSTVLLISGVVLVAASSAFAGYKFAERRLKPRYEQLASDEIAQAKEYYSRLYKTDERFATPEAALNTLVPEDERSVEEPTTDDVIEDAAKLAAEYVTTENRVSYDKIYDSVRGKDVPVVVTESITEKIEVAKNVFTNAIPGEFDYDAELEKRTPEQPYIITEEEFLENEPEHEQANLTYFEKDDILADEADRPVTDTNATVGDDNLVRFGQGTPNPNVVFIRNERLKYDFEVVRSTGSFAEEVHQLSHSEDDFRGGIRKFRHGDDG